MKIKIIRDPYDKRKYLYKSSFIDLSNGATVIIGHNGSGKTTLLRQIETYCKDNTIPFIKYDNYGDGGSAAKEHYGFTGDFASLAATSFHSEGEQIFYNFGKIVEKMSAFVKQNKDSEKIFILLDALDSGLDIEGIEQIRSIFNIIMSEREGKETYILITANNYGLIHNMQCYDVVSGEHKLFTDFEDYKKFILNSMRRREMNNKWISVKDALPKTDNKNTYKFNVLVYVKSPKNYHQESGIYLGKLNKVEADNGSSNIFGRKTDECEWTVWGWSYYEKPIVTHWMKLPTKPRNKRN